MLFSDLRKCRKEGWDEHKNAFNSAPRNAFQPKIANTCTQFPLSPLTEWLRSQGEWIDGYWASNPTSPAEIAAGKLQRLDEIHEFRELVLLLLLHLILPLSGKEFCHGAHKSMPLLRLCEAFKSRIRILELLPPARQDGISGLNTVIVLLKWTNGTAN